MALTSQQKADIHRLRENEMLTGNLTDAAATAVLDWAEAQVAAGVPYDTVVAGVKAANGTGTEDPSLALAAAHQVMAARATTQAVAPPPSDKPAATARPKAARRRRARSGGATPSAAVPFEDRLPLPTAGEGPDDNHADGAPEPGAPREDKLPLPTSREGPDDASDDPSGSADLPTWPPAPTPPRK